MIDFLRQLFDTSDFTPRWNCGVWSEAHGWTHVVADLATWGAYAAVSAWLVHLIWRRQDVRFPRTLWLFAAFIFACGAVHLIEATLFWTPWYRLSALFKVVTALVSWATVVALVRVTPSVMTLPSMAHMLALVESSEDAIVSLDTSGRITTWNSAATELFGAPAAQAIGRDFAELLDSDKQAEWRRQLEASHRELVTAPIEIVRGTSERPVHLSARVSRILDRSKRLAGFALIARDVTRYVDSERRLQRFASMLESVIDASPTATVLVDDTGRVRLANSAAGELFGGQREELVDRSVEELMPQAMRESHVALRNAYLLSPTPRRMSGPREIPALRLDGEIVPTEIQLTPVEFHEGVAVLASITDLRAKRLARFEGERRFREIADSLPQLVWTCEPGGACDFLNRRWVEYTGIPASSQLGSAWLAQLHPDDRARVATEWGAAVEAHSDFRVEFRIRGANGRYRWFDTRGRPLTDERGAVTKWFGSCTDIDEQHELREKLSQNSAIVEGSQDAIVGQSLDDVVTSWNAAAAQIYGYTAAEIIGQSVLKLIPEDRREEHQQLIVAIQRGEKGEARDTIRLHRSGARIEVSLAVSPIYDATGAIVGASKVARDISARRESERRLIRLTDELRRSNSDLEQFAYAASHDLQEPLRMIRIYLQKLEAAVGQEIPASSSQYIETCVRASRRMSSLIADLLAYSRLRQSNLRPARVDLNSTIRAVRENLAAALEDAGAELLHGELPTLRGDETQLVQLFQNLIGNAIKFRGKHPPRIEVIAERTREGFEIRVVDNGIGIDPAHHERIFGVFKRLHGAQQYPGTGIGLALCKLIAERHGGSIRVESAVGRGSAFILDLPEAIVEP